MQESVTVSEQDMQLVAALQISPRASFAQLADVLGVSPATLSRRWGRLSAEGLAWVLATPSARFVTTGCIAYVEVRCRPSTREQAATTLSLEPAIASVDLTAGPSDLILSIATSDLPALSRYLIERIDKVPGVLSTNTFLATHGYRQGGDWRLSSLAPRQVNSLAVGSQADEPLLELTSFDRNLLLALGEDGRMSHADLADRTGSSPATVRRRMSRLLRSRAVGMRCDICAPAFGWPVSSYISARVTSGRLSTVASAIAKLPQVRLVTTVTGSVNIFMSMWLSSIDALTHAEERIGSAYPDWRVVDRIVVLHAMKRAGRLLDQYGRSVGTVPMVYSEPSS